MADVSKVEVGATIYDIKATNGVPASTTSDAGKFLVVNSSGVPTWTNVPAANGVSF